MIKQWQAKVGQSAPEKRPDSLALLAALVTAISAAKDPLVPLERALPAIARVLEGNRARIVRNAGEAGENNPIGLRLPLATPGPDGRLTLEVQGPASWDSLDKEQQHFAMTLQGFARLALDRMEMHQRLTLQNQVSEELDLAAELQQSLQPKSDPASMPIWGMNRPARKVSGDFYDHYRLDQERIVFALGDVSGKGMNAAILMAKTIGLFRCLGKRIDQPSALLQAINAELTETATRGMFVTMVAGLYWPRQGRVRFANAGHQPPLWRRPDRSYQSYPAEAPPLGILQKIAPEDRDIDLAGGEFYIFTDGLTEYRHSSGEELGVDGFIQLIEMFAGEDPARRLELLLETLAAESGWEVRDDLTVLAIDDSWVKASGGFEGQKCPDQDLRGRETGP